MKNKNRFLFSSVLSLFTRLCTKRILILLVALLLFFEVGCSSQLERKYFHYGPHLSGGAEEEGGISPRLVYEFLEAHAPQVNWKVLGEALIVADYASSEEDSVFLAVSRFESFFDDSFVQVWRVPLKRIDQEGYGLVMAIEAKEILRVKTMGELMEIYLSTLDQELIPGMPNTILELSEKLDSSRVLLRLPLELSVEEKNRVIREPDRIPLFNRDYLAAASESYAFALWKSGFTFDFDPYTTPLQCRVTFGSTLSDLMISLEELNLKRIEDLNNRPRFPARWKKMEFDFITR